MGVGPSTIGPAATIRGPTSRPESIAVTPVAQLLEPFDPHVADTGNTVDDKGAQRLLARHAEVDMHVPEPRDQEAALAVDGARPGGGPDGLGRADLDDPVPLHDHDAAGLQGAGPGVHDRDVPEDEERVHSGVVTARGTAGQRETEHPAACGNAHIHPQGWNCVSVRNGNLKIAEALIKDLAPDIDWCYGPSWLWQAGSQRCGRRPNCPSILPGKVDADSVPEL